MEKSVVTIGIVPTGNIGSHIVKSTMTEIQSILSALYKDSGSTIKKVECRIIPARPIPNSAIAKNLYSGNYNVNPFFTAAAKMKDMADRKRKIQDEPALDKTIIFTEVPLFSNDNLGGVCGEADKNGSLAVISLDKLRDAHSKTHDIKERLVKVTLHEIGHMYDLEHCYNKNCPMSSSLSYHDVDIINKWYCKECSEKMINKAEEHYLKWDGG